ncbi:oxidoreductase domain protein [Gemmatirosa kalamazoonensis]|uniref:Oxidoreductase domain protein n=1 Tax=Gemmatirosa kalamazoonensis TaxID=861299 RepID=W0RD82_9BACT|nr:Gfo/Idh/MocA family oxidoreductase [Gemmatirosa kalamazoonensis]AHG88402.1 oxidoreductase domain protein [Gemmatirosa kalamazoonensis]
MRVAFVGCGYVADFYARTMARYPALRLACVTDRDAERARRLAAVYGTRCVPSLDDVLGDPTIELVVNLTNPSSHAEVSRAALGAGKHVYSEKPLALSLDDAASLARCAEARGLVLAAAPCTLLGANAQTMWRALRSGTIGRPRLVYAELDDGPVHLMNYRAWRTASGVSWPWRDEFQSGSALEHAAYHLSWLVAFFGPATRVSAFASMLVPDKGTDAPLVDAAPDFTVACVEFASGVVARLTCGIYAPRDRSVTVVGDGGVLRTADCWNERSPVHLTRRTRLFERVERRPLAVRALRRRVPLARPPGISLGGRDPIDFARGLAEAASAIRDGRPCRLGADLAVHVTETVLALRTPSPAPRALRTTCRPVAPMPWAES